MRFQWFEDLANLSSTGNFSRAAQLSHSSQPAFSRRIKALEAWVGVPLVDRSAQPARLTDSGLQMLEAGTQAMTRIESSRQQVREAMAHPDKTMVTFATQHSIGWRFYPQWLQAFETAFGPILSRLRADNLPDCMADLERGAVDCVIAYDGPILSAKRLSRSIQSVIVGRDRLVPVSRADASGRPVFSLQSRSKGVVPYLRFGQSAPLGQHVEAIVNRLRIASRLHPVYENSMSGALRIRVRDGQGLAWLPLSLVEPDIEAGLLALAGHDRHGDELVIRLYRESGNQKKLVQRIWAFLVAREGKPLA